MILDACGAYGRQPKLRDWFKGLDFKIITGPYFSIRDIEKLKSDGWTEIRFSFVQHGAVCNFTVKL